MSQFSKNIGNVQTDKDQSMFRLYIFFAYVNHNRIWSWNQPVLSIEGKVSCSSKQQEPLMWLELLADRHPSIMSQTRYPMRHAVPGGK